LGCVVYKLKAAIKKGNVLDGKKRDLENVFQWINQEKRFP